QQLTQQPYEYTPLVDIQAVSNIPRQSPLFESVVVFENYPLELAEGLGGLDLLDVAITEQTHYPLTLFATASETLNFKMLYDTQRFEVGAIARLLGHLHSTLVAIVANAQQSISNISILSASEQKQLFDYGKGTSVKVSDQCIKDAVAQHAHANPAATALLFEGDAISYSQLDSRANQLAHYLRQQGIESNTVIGLCAERSVEMVIALLAILKLGCAYVPLDPTHPVARLQYVVEDAGISWLICHAATAQIVKSGEVQQIDISQAANAIAAQPISELDVAVAPTDLAYLIYTSGSTGKPKGVPITHQSLNNLLAAMTTRLQVTPADTLMAVTTFAFDIAALELFLPLVSGACLLLASNETVRDGHRLMADLETYGVDIMQATPATWRLLLSSGWTGQNGLKILCGGEALDSSLAKVLLDCGEEVWNVYGPTETTIWSGALALTKDLIEAGNVPIGHPIDNTHFYVLDEQQRPVPIGVAGELYIGGLGLSQGYWHRPDLTADRFVQVGERVFYRTGDRVRYREDGTLDYLGRFDYQAKLRGHRIELGEIESAMALHPHINQAVAMLQGDTAENQRLVAYVTLDDREETNELQSSTGNTLQFSVGDALRSHLTRQLPHYMVPTAYQVLPAFPLTPNGKVDRKALPAVTQSAITPDVRPKTAIENTLAEIWRSILPAQEETTKTAGEETISIHDNFFEIGGHSLLVINAQSQIRQQLGIELSMVDLFRYPTLNTLATHIDQLTEKRETTKTAGEETISIHDNFFEIGGHSLLVINAQSQIRQQLGIELSMVDLFRYPTLNTLATHIDQLTEKRETTKTAGEETISIHDNFFEIGGHSL
ncbi:MAG: amino acid adenylation domain-containing protein, partial [Cyanobacteria bacterium J06576_12]